MRVELIPAREEFAEVFLKWRSQSSTRRFNPVKSLGLAETRKRLRDSGSELRALSPGVEYRWFARAGEELVGSVSLSGFNSMMLTAEIGYIIGDEHSGRGFGTAAVQELVRKVFSETGIRKLIAMIHVDNIASSRLIERVGFRQEGRLREHYLVAGCPTDEFIYGLLRSDLA